ncbi:MAG TPA: carbohydrate kinase family protein [Tepidisphaeraceae bacterium]|jgi:sugar/nucleoside kinase (ribokinase family)
MDAATFGVIVADVIGEPLDLRNPPRAGSLSLLNRLLLTTGGNVCNVSLAMAKLGMTAAGAGLVGDDIFGRAIIERLKSAGVDTTAIFTSDKAQTSATIVAAEPGGQRTFFHQPGVLKMLGADEFRRCFDVFRQCAWVQIGYFGLLPALTPELPNLLKELRQTAPGAKIALDTVHPPADWDLLKPILPHIDLFAPSRPEAEELSGYKRPEKIAGFFRKHMEGGQGLVGIKLDEDGCYLDDGKHAAVVPAYKVDCIDTTGAGDSWFAGLLVALRKDMPLEQAAHFANRVAADCCTALGASAGVKSFEETMARL